MLKTVFSEFTQMSQTHGTLSLNKKNSSVFVCLLYHCLNYCKAKSRQIIGCFTGDERHKTVISCFKRRVVKAALNVVVDEDDDDENP